MTIEQDVDFFLQDLKLKIRMFGILYLDERGKNAQAFADLEIPSNKRKEIIEQLKTEDYSQGPLEEKMRGILPMWVFGKNVKHKEVYIKISLGIENQEAVCISFHLAEHPMNYPFKK